MSDYLKSNEAKIKKTKLDKKLEAVLENGFMLVGDCIFLTSTYPPNYDRLVIKEENIKEQFVDFSGYEYSTNKFHIEDFTDQDPFIQSIIFSRKFKEKWLTEFPHVSCTILISFQDDEIGKFATFTFHKCRKNEVVFKLDNLEDVMQPLYIEKISKVKHL